MKKKNLSLVSLMLAFAAVQSLAASPVVGPENVRNLRLLENSPMLFELHRVTTGEGRQFFAYPQRDTTFRKNFVNSEGKALLYYDSEHGASVSGYRDSCTSQDSVCNAELKNLNVPRMALAMSLVGGIDYRGGEALNDTIGQELTGAFTCAAMQIPSTSSWTPEFMTKAIRRSIRNLSMGNFWKSRRKKTIRVSNIRAMLATAPILP